MLAMAGLVTGSALSGIGLLSLLIGFGLALLLPLGAIVGMILSGIALSQANKRFPKNNGLARTGVIVASSTLGVWVVLVVTRVLAVRG
ncbi:hypothetical protein ACOBQX_13155 [Actinokineospora sp. G85]|uniref:hypothetical protein n=1 Tax=Actinokineospora sp. G85 TaxID=3406626 RepID=UPI003C7884B1